MTRPVPARGKHQLRFTYSQWFPQWEASFPLVESPFGRDTLKITVDRATAWEPVTEDELALIDEVLDRMPELLAIVISKLTAWDESLQNADVFRQMFHQPSICLLKKDEQLRKSWAFVLERHEFEGDNWGVHLEFVGDQFQEMWAGD